MRVPTPAGAEHLDRTPLEDTGADAAEHVLARLPLEHDRLVAGQVQQPRQHQPGGPAPDDDDLRYVSWSSVSRPGS